VRQEHGSSSQADFYRKKGALSALLAIVLAVGTVLAVPTLSEEFPTRTVLTICCGFVWPSGWPCQGVREPATRLRTVFFLLTLPLIAPMPLLLVSREAFA